MKNFEWLPGAVERGMLVSSAMSAVSVYIVKCRLFASRDASPRSGSAVVRRASLNRSVFPFRDNRSFVTRKHEPIARISRTAVIGVKIVREKSVAGPCTTLGVVLRETDLRITYRDRYGEQKFISKRWPVHSEPCPSCPDYPKANTRMIRASQNSIAHLIRQEE